MCDRGEYTGVERRTILPECKLQIDHISDNIKNLNEVITLLNQNISDRNTKIDKILMGNGELGICAKVKMIWATSILLVISVAGLWIKDLYSSLKGFIK